MPGKVIHKADQCVKTAFLVTIDAIGNKSSIGELTKIKEALLDDAEFKDLLKSITGGDHEVGNAELRHVFTDWFGSHGYWPRAKAEAIVRNGLVRAIDLQLEHADSEGRPMAVDYWWMPDTPSFGFSILPGPAQITGIISTPPIPRSRRGAQTRGRERAGTTKKKSSTRRKRPR